jgi:hypothetical protein
LRLVHPTAPYVLNKDFASITWMPFEPLTGLRHAQVTP